MRMMVSLRVNDLKQYAYCSRIVFYQYVMPVEKATSFKMDCGRVAEETIDRLEARRGLKRYALTEGGREFHKTMSSERLGLSGKLDLLITVRDECFPVDFKFTEGRPHRNHVYQLCGYALIIEDIYKSKVTKGFVYLIPSEEVVEFDISGELKAGAMEMLDSIRKMIASERMPEATVQKNKCLDCEYKNYCGDIF